MYLYFDNNGILKEIINDNSLRKGNSNINSLYVFWEGYSNAITNVFSRYKMDNNSVYPSASTFETDYEEEDAIIDYDPKRDLKFFQYGKTYHFYVLPIPDEVLAVGGSVLASIWFAESNNITTMGQVAFNVDESTLSVAEDENINVAQWNELMKYFTNGRTFVVDGLDNVYAPNGSILFNTDDNTIYYWNGTTATAWYPEVSSNIQRKPTIKTLNNTLTLLTSTEDNGSKSTNITFTDTVQDGDIVRLYLDSNETYTGLENVNICCVDIKITSHEYAEGAVATGGLAYLEAGSSSVGFVRLYFRIWVTHDLPNSILINTVKFDQIGSVPAYAKAYVTFYVRKIERIRPQ